MFLVAITGGIASGKSTVTNVFRENGVPIVDADLIARQIVEPGKPAWYQIKEVFGDEILKDNKEINREILGRLIFNDKEKRRKLNEITHPIIHRQIFYEICYYFATGANYVVMDLPLLFETGILIDFIHKIITVTCDEDTQVKRLLDRNQLSEEDARKRIQAQMPLEKKCEKSHFVIDNSGPIENTRQQALNILQILNSSKQHWKVRAYLGISCMALIAVTLWFYSLFKY